MDVRGTYALHHRSLPFPRLSGLTLRVVAKQEEISNISIVEEDEDGIRIGERPTIQHIFQRGCKLL